MMSLSKIVAAGLLPWNIYTISVQSDVTNCSSAVSDRDSGSDIEQKLADVDLHLALQSSSNVLEEDDDGENVGYVRKT